MPKSYYTGIGTDVIASCLHILWNWVTYEGGSAPDCETNERALQTDFIRQTVSLSVIIAEDVKAGKFSFTPLNIWYGRGSPFGDFLIPPQHACGLWTDSPAGHKSTPSSIAIGLYPFHVFTFWLNSRSICNTAKFKAVDLNEATTTWAKPCNRVCIVVKVF